MNSDCGADDDSGDDDTNGDDDTLGDDDNQDDDAASDDDAGGDDDSAGDDDDSASGSAPVISNFQIWIDIPSGETEEMVNFAFDFTDAEGDINGGHSFIQFTLPDGIGPYGSDEVSDPDATSGTLYLGFMYFGPDWGIVSGATITFHSGLTDRAGNESNELDEPFTFP